MKRPVGYRARLVDPHLAHALTSFPAVLLTGPRAVGKTTTARRHAATVVELDNPAQAAQFHADPSSALAATRRASNGPVLLDEWQQAPEVLAAVKRAVDAGAEPGSFILTGSVRAPFTTPSWPGTGRLITVEMHPMTVREQHGTAEPTATFIRHMLEGRLDLLEVPADPPDLAGYVDLAVAGGLPPVLGRDAARRRIWLDSYIDQLVLRDAPEMGGIRDSEGLHRYLRATAETAGTLTADTVLADAAGINVKTARRHERLLEDLRVIATVPAWHTNRLSRLTKQRKRYPADTGMAAALLGVDAAAVRRDGTVLGRTIEAFALAQLRPLLATVPHRVAAHHLRLQDGRREIDLLLETGDGTVAAIEIKASASPGREAAKHLCWLRDELGERFVAGVVLHTGPAAYRLSERVTAMPIASLWT